jgi:gamma-glutamyltranspeptidase / glutathione hydrolase
MRTITIGGCTCFAFLALLFNAVVAIAQTTGIASPAICNSDGQQLPFCNAVSGDRSEGWLLQKRSEVMASRGMVTTSQPLAAEAGMRILQQGGNAIDAAVATAAVLNVTEPMNIGVGGDLFFIIYSARDHTLYHLNASGKAPTGYTLQNFNNWGWTCPVNTGPGCGMPVFGILSVTVPGVVWGWDQALRKLGTMSFAQVLAPAIDYAENGYPVSERISNDWTIPSLQGVTKAQGSIGQDPDTIAAWTINGQSPLPGQIFKNPDLAHTFKLIAEQGPSVFYRGEIAQAIVAKSRKLGGTMTLADLANYSGYWRTPPSTTYDGYTIYETNAPSQAWSTLEALNILEACSSKMLGGRTLGQVGPASPAFWHFLVEAKKLAYNDLYAYNGDPAFVNVPVATLTSKQYAASLCAQINPNSSAPISLVGNGGSDTIVLSTADRWGNIVAWVNSNYNSFGSGITVPGYGFILHDRGALFSLWNPPAGQPPNNNMIQPGKQPFNTLSAGFAVNNANPGQMMAFEVMSGDMQAQGHLQVLVNMLDLGANLQAATDMARFHHSQVSDSLQLETDLYDLVGQQLIALGHKNTTSTNGAAMGGYQAIMLTPTANSPEPNNGFYRAGSDHRKDGTAVGW